MAAAAVWGGTFVVVRAGIEHVTPLLFVAVRFTLAACLLAPLALRRGSLPGRAAWRAGLWTGAPLFAGFALQTIGLQWTPPGRAAFLTALYVVLVPVLAPLAGARRPGARTWGAVGLALLGTYALTRDAGGSMAWNAGDLCMVGCALSFAVQILAVDRVARNIPSLELLLTELTVVAALAWPAVTLESPAFRATPTALASLATVVLLASLGALAAQNWAQRRVAPSRTAVIFALEPVFAALASWAVLGERLTPVGAAGAAAILLAMVVCGRAGRA